MASLEVTLQAADGARLGATLFRPASPSSANGACVQVNSAAGVKQEYYAPFAEYLASRGFAVLTYDYRGVGRSVDGHVRDMPARMRDWAVLDASCAFSFLEKNYKKIFVVAHSFGGQAVAVMPGNERITAALAVGSQSCYWRLWRGGMRAGMWLLVRALLPGATKLWGYFPGALLRQGENLPPGVALEWARWCRDPRYLVGALGAEEQAAKVRSPYRLYCISDDFYAPLPAAQALLDLIENGKTEMRVVHPRELGVERIGHFGFFRERFRDTLWREAAEWLERQ